MEVLQRTANRGSISTGFDIDNSCKFENANSEYMARTPAGNGNLQICTLSVWLKRTELGVNRNFFTGDYGGAADPWFILGFQNDRLYFSSTAGVSGNAVVPTRLFRDTSAWYHMVFAIDTTQATAADRVKIYINGIQETVFTTTNYPALNDNLDIMAAKEQRISGYGTEFFNGYMSEFVGIDGQALAPTEFGEFDADSGIWKPIDVSGLTFGTNGFYLDFKDSANLGNDASGGTDFTETNITSADQATDSPTNNFCTWSPLWAEGRANGTISEGATQVAWGGGAWKAAKGSIGVSKGRWYWEIKGANVTGDTWNNNFFGFAATDQDGQTGPSVFIGYSTGNYYYKVDGSQTGQDNWGNAGGAWSSSDTFGFALDLESSTKKFILYRNGSAVNGSGTDLVSGFQTEQFFTPYATSYNGDTQFLNFGGYTVNTISSPASDANGYGTFEYAPPSGYYALCTKNLAEFG